jgi:hypothetical protein
MSKESKKFPAVMTVNNVLGLPEGTILKFDWASGKYVSVVEEEDIAEEYYYSGFAVAIDPYVVKDNIGTAFTFIEQVEEPVVEKPKEEVKVETPKKVKKSKKVAEPVVEEKVDNDGFPEYTVSHALVVDCECGHRGLLQVIKAPGINITLMAGDDNSIVDLHCTECGANLKLWFAPENEVANEPTEEESN